MSVLTAIVKSSSTVVPIDGEYTTSY